MYETVVSKWPVTILGTQNCFYASNHGWDNPRIGDPIVQDEAPSHPIDVVKWIDNFVIVNSLTKTRRANKSVEEMGSISGT